MKGIFVIGILQRSGTNYVTYLLKQHPDCIPSMSPAEDFILSNSHLLLEYSRKVARNWLNKWGDKKSFEKKLIESIGKGILLNFLQPSDTSKYFVSKTPVSNNLHFFHTIFPDSKLIIVLRNGKDVVESGIKSNFWNFHKGCIYWNMGAKAIIKFLDSCSNNKFHLLKYEELINNFEMEVINLYKYCELDISKINIDEIKESPIIGSSTELKDKKPTWKPRKRTKDFNPLERSAHWSNYKKCVYEFICGKHERKLGYNKNTVNVSLYILFNFFNFPIYILYSSWYTLKEIYKHYI